ncbi:MAG: DEAD/DEAH box helicase [Myxococcales bacterium]|nr:DEAD/DEAH box helicase [Myxococcales bacterium]
MSFADLGAHPALLQTLEARGYVTPTPVQAAVLDAAMLGRDLLVSAETGSGKTVAFGLALAHTLLGEESALPRATTPKALVLAPTRELALQVQQELAWLYGSAGMRSVACVGGAPMAQQLRALADGVHLVVGTPGRICDHIERGSLKLGEMKALVLDEADEMLDMGFRDELDRVLAVAPKGHRALWFSATLPREVGELAKKWLENPARVAATPAQQAHADIKYVVNIVAFREREHAVVNVLRAHDAPAAIVFCATREEVSRLQATLRERGFRCVGLSGELTQPERARALQMLRDGHAKVLVATDVAARGLDLPDVSLVIHADPPRDAMTLQHRSGRTGRAGRKGTAVLLVSPDRRQLLARMLRTANVSTASWEPCPTAETIRGLDDDRLVTRLEATGVTPSDEDIAVARRLLAKRPAEELVAALVTITRGEFPEPEDLPMTVSFAQKLLASMAQPQRSYERPAMPQQRYDRNEFRGGAGGEARPEYTPGPRPDAPPSARPAYAPAGPRGSRTEERLAARSDERSMPRPEERYPARPDERGPGPGPGSWFVLNVGREKRADPRWLIPVLCRWGGLQKEDIGVIRVMDRETRVEILGRAATTFKERTSMPDRLDPTLRAMPMEDQGPPRRPPPRSTWRKTTER